MSVTLDHVWAVPFPFRMEGSGVSTWGHLPHPHLGSLKIRIQIPFTSLTQTRSVGWRQGRHTGDGHFQVAAASRHSWLLPLPSTVFPGPCPRNCGRLDGPLGNSACQPCDTCCDHQVAFGQWGQEVAQAEPTRAAVGTAWTWPAHTSAALQLGRHHGSVCWDRSERAVDIRAVPRPWPGVLPGPTESSEPSNEPRPSLQEAPCAHSSQLWEGQRCPLPTV